LKSGGLRKYVSGGFAQGAVFAKFAQFPNSGHLCNLERKIAANALIKPACFHLSLLVT